MQVQFWGMKTGTALTVETVALKRNFSTGIMAINGNQILLNAQELHKLYISYPWKRKKSDISEKNEEKIGENA